MTNKKYFCKFKKHCTLFIVHHPLSTIYYQLSTFTANPPFPTVYFLLSTANYPMPRVHYPLFTVHQFSIHYPLFTAHCLKPTTHCLLSTAHCLLPTVYLLSNCPLTSVCYTLFTALSLLPTAHHHCPLFTTLTESVSTECQSKIYTSSYLIKYLIEHSRHSGQRTVDIGQ
jgi:hypothetical protein